MRSGKLIELFADDETYVFARQLGAETIVIAFNRDRQKHMFFPVGTIGVKDGVMLRSLIGGTDARLEHGQVTLRLPPQSAAAWKAF
jgi:hypothetical protein